MADPFDTSASPDFWRNLQQFGFATMAAGAQPGATTLGALGQGGLAAMEASKQNALARAQAQHMGAETDQLKIKNATAQRNIDMTNAAYGIGQKPSGAQAGMPISPSAGMATPNQPSVVSVGGKQYPFHQLNAIANGPYSPSSPDEAYAASGLATDEDRKKQLLEYAMGGQIAGEKAKATLPYDVAKSAAGATRVNVMNAQETAEGKKVGEAFGEDYVNIIKAGKEAPTKIAKYERMNQLLKGIDTGTFKGTTTELKAAAKGIGIDLEQYGIKDDVAPIQAAQAMTNAMALDLRSPAGGAGMPGAMSDSDRVFLSQMVPGIEKTKEGRKLMTETATKLAKRDQEVAQLARNYRSKNGKLDEGFYDTLAQYSEKNPLFTKQTTTKPVVPANRKPLDSFLK